jgi:hypothetical protein
MPYREKSKVSGRNTMNLFCVGVLPGLHFRMPAPWNGELVAHADLYYELTYNTHEMMDAAVGGAFLSLTLTQAINHVEKMVCNHTWNEERQPRKRERGMHPLKEVACCLPRWT